MAEPNVLTPGQDIRPKLDVKTAIDLVRRLYGLIVVNIYELNAYDDKNYHVICEKRHENSHIDEIMEHGYVLKILNSLDSRDVSFVEGQNEMMLYLSKREIRCTVPIKNLHGTFYSLEKLQCESKEGHVIRLLAYQPGSTLYNFPLTIKLLHDVGHFVAHFDAALKNFSHPAYDNRSSLWMLSAVPRLRDFLYPMKNNDDRQMINEIIDNFENNVLTIVGELKRGIIHGDMNEQNLLVDSEGTRIMAVIDFGDSHESCLIYELAIAICYMLIQSRDPSSAKFVIEGYQSVRKLESNETGILKICVCARLCQSLAIGIYSHAKDPQNDYLLVTQKFGWDILRKLWPMEDKEVLRIWGLENSALTF